MSYIDTFPIQHSTVIRIYSERETIKLDPEYQRYGDVWTPEKKRLLIDSIINDYDLPKLYFHSFDRTTQKATGFMFSVIDGRQRLQAIWEFIDGKFTLDDNFTYLNDETINLSNLTYEEIGKAYPKIKIKFDSFVLPIIGVETDDLELVEDMFSRLNEAVPLNAAEKRNAFGGTMAKLIRDIAEHKFFKEYIRISNSRYQHREVVARFLFMTISISTDKKIIDTKKMQLDTMVKTNKDKQESDLQKYKDEVILVLDLMVKIFDKKDVLLNSQGSMNPYFLIFRHVLLKTPKIKIDRSNIKKFIDEIKANRIIAESDYEKANFDYLEYDRLSQQGTNDSTSIRERYRILKNYLLIPGENDFV